ncbi:MAG: deoxyribose-phosphate aldolase [Phycisphaerae bacterium]
MTDKTQLARLLPIIDYADALRLEATDDDVLEACRTARQYGLASVAVFANFIATAAEALAGSSVAVQCPVGFPSGGHTTAVKLAEAENALANGATEIDMVMAIGRFKSGHDDYVEDEIRQIVQAAARSNVHVKVIIEVGLLSDDEKVRAARLAERAGAAFVKTCTGFGPGRCTVHDVTLLRRALNPATGVKASGGVLWLEDALAFMQAGASRVAARRSIIQQLQADGIASSADLS